MGLNCKRSARFSQKWSENTKKSDQNANAEKLWPQMKNFVLTNLLIFVTCHGTLVIHN